MADPALETHISYLTERLIWKEPGRAVMNRPVAQSAQINTTSFTYCHLLAKSFFVVLVLVCSNQKSGRQKDLKLIMFMWLQFT